MTDREGKKPPSLGWIDILGLAALASIATGAGLVWGVGWALLISGGLLGLVYAAVEMFIPARARRAGERRR